MKFDKNTLLVKVEMFATATFSNAKSYGKFFVTTDFFDKHEDYMRDIDYEIDELDGKHATTTGYMTFTRGTIGQFAKEIRPEANLDEDYRMLELLPAESEDVYMNLAKLNKTMDLLCMKETKTIVLSEDQMVDGVDIPKGTELTYKVPTNNYVDNFSLELDM